MTKAEFRRKAKEVHTTDELEVPVNARVSVADDGAWVQAWVWVRLPDEEVTE